MKNKTVFITGASSGIGSACAEYFAKEGANLILAARRLDRLKQKAKQLKTDYQVDVLSMRLDVCNKNEVNEVISSLEGIWSDIDILINNAGMSLSSEKLQDVPVEMLDKVINVNIKGLLYVTKAILPGMLSRKSGHIINIGSLASHFIYPGGNIYVPTKHAVKAISQMLRVDLLGTPIRVTQVDPGVTQTEFSDARWGKQKAKEFYSKRISLKPSDIAEAVLFCASRDSYINVDDIVVNTIDMAGCYTS